MLTWRCQIGYFLKNIDLSNVNNAFLSGMEEDLSMYGNQLVTSVSIYTVGYVIGQIPSNLLLTRVSPRWVIPTVCTTFPDFSTASLPLTLEP
jgi:ACS family pantothenate transporter-like MFS transporter